VRILIVDDNAHPEALPGQIDGVDLTVQRWPARGQPDRDGAEEIAAIARSLREFEEELGNGGPDAVLLGSDSSAALAAVIVATKLGTPVASLAAAGVAESAGTNHRLIRQLSDTILAPEPAAIAAWLRASYTPEP
jgi:UDP-N-acetylglucosamine 2-epimerase